GGQVRAAHRRPARRRRGGRRAADAGGPTGHGGGPMRFVESIRIALQAIAANRLRSALTTLGILIGVAAVIILVAVGNGASVAVNNQVQSLGANVIYVYPSNARGTGGVSQGFGSGQTLTQADVDAINNRQQAPDVVAAIPIAQSGG